ncbi:MAG: ribokinase [Planctomycetia bacterium]|nr:ribokinase [Planctomycetia bacterium]
MGRILVLGSSNTDLTVRLPQLPTPGQTVLGGALVTGPGGKGANQAVAAARAGGKVAFVTSVGDDAFGRASLGLYRDEGIDVSHARTRPGEASGVALIFVDADGENMIGVAPGANARLGPDDVDGLPDALFGPDGLLLLAGLEVPLEVARRAAGRARGSGMIVVLNPAPFPANLHGSGLLDRVDVVCLNRVELGQMTGLRTETERGLAEAVTKVRSTSGGVGFVVTLGADGCLVLVAGRTEPISAHPTRAVDTVGAGDAFNGALAVALAEGRTLSGAAHWASAAAAIAVTRAGAQSALPFRAEIERLAAAHGRTA